MSKSMEKPIRPQSIPGIAQIDLDLISNTYAVELGFDGDGNYQSSSNTYSITIKPTIIG